MRAGVVVSFWLCGLVAATPPAALGKLWEETYIDAKMDGEGIDWEDRAERLAYAQDDFRNAMVAPPEDAATFRFHNAKTQAARVSTLPDVQFNIGEMYSGLMPVKKGDNSRQLFYIFQPSINEPSDTLTIWLNGGPGCSSLEGFFQENGRYVWLEGHQRPTINKYSWVNLTNVLWVEQPVGTGFTVGQATARSQEETAADFIGFFRNFQEHFGIKNFKIYVTGESYAGRYVPYIADAMLRQKDKDYFDLKGILMYDACIGHYNMVQQQVTAFPFVQNHKEHFNFTGDQMKTLEDMHAKCGYKQHIDKYMTFPPPGTQSRFPRRNQCDVFNRIQYSVRSKNQCFNVYDIGQRCPKKTDPMKGQVPYFNRADVKTALHAPKMNWVMCTRKRVYTAGMAGPAGNGDLSSDPIEKVLPNIIHATNRVMVVNGDYDFIIQSNGTLLAIQNMTWNGQLGFQKRPVTPITLPGEGVRGVQHYEKGLMWADSFETGHMGPGMAPSLSWQHLRWLLGQVETL